MCAVCEHYCTSCTDLLQLYKDAQQLRERCNGRARKRTRRDYIAHHEFKYHEIHHKQDWHKLLLEIASVAGRKRLCLAWIGLAWL